LACVASFPGYERVRQVAAGRTRVVFAAVRRGLKAAIKAYPAHLSTPEARAALGLEEELQRAASDVAPRVIEVGEVDGSLYLAEEWVEGAALSHEPVPGKARELAAAAAGAVAGLHAAGLVHGDLKPANVLKAARGVRLIDFGSARRVAPKAGDPAPLQRGTRGYLAPELAGGAGATPASDVFALGCLIAEVFAPRRVFASRGDAEYWGALAALERHGPRTVLGHLDPAVAEALAPCLETEPGRRPGAEQVGEALGGR
jgi:serine/threonine protein kinase